MIGALEEEGLLAQVVARDLDLVELGGLFLLKIAVQEAVVLKSAGTHGLGGESRKRRTVGW